MIHLEDKIDIQATQGLVWEITIDVESWPQWSPAMEKVVREDPGEFKLGSSALIKQKLMPRTRWVVTELDPGRSFSWHTKVLGIEMKASHLILPDDSGVTSILKIEMKGGIATILSPLLKPPVRLALKEENCGLKNFCESRG